MFLVGGQRYACRLGAGNGIDSLLSTGFNNGKLLLMQWWIWRIGTCRLLERSFWFLWSTMCLFRLMTTRWHNLLFVHHFFFRLRLLLSIVFVCLIFRLYTLFIINDYDWVIKLDTIVNWFGCFRGFLGCLRVGVCITRQVREAGSFWWLLTRTLLPFRRHDKVVEVPVWRQFLAARCFSFLAFGSTFSVLTIFVQLWLLLLLLHLLTNIRKQ